MTIPASQLVDITNRTISGGLNGLELNGLALSRNENLPVGNVFAAYSAEQVAEYFGANAPEAVLAVNYFLSDDNKQKTPSALYFYRHVNTVANAFLRGAAYAGKLGQLQAIEDGALNLRIDGVAANLSDLDFSEQTSFSAVAGVIQTAIRATAGLEAATVSYSSLYSAFMISSGTGAESTIEFATPTETGTDLSAVLNLTEAAGAVLSQGSAAETLTETLNELWDGFQNFFGLATVFQETEAEGLEIASFVNGKGTRLAYFFTETSAAAKNANNSTCFAQQVKSYYGVCSCFNSKAYTFFDMSIPASTDYERLRGRKTAAYRSQAGLTPTVTGGADAINLLNNGYNFYGAYGTGAADFELNQNGQISGQAEWLDTYAGQVWLKFALQAAWLTCMQANNTLPFNNDGYGAIKAAALDPINAAVNAGVIVPGVTLSEGQKNTVNTSAGQDISEQLYTQGWALIIPDASAITRANRGPLKPDFYYCDGGSIQKIEGSATTIL